MFDENDRKNNKQMHRKQQSTQKTTVLHDRMLRANISSERRQWTAKGPRQKITHIYDQIMKNDHTVHTRSQHE